MDCEHYRQGSVQADFRWTLTRTYRRLFMKWQTPTATDFRFGFEITMYIASR